MLFGGALERESNQWLARESGDFAIDTGSDRTLRDYFSLLDLCAVVVTGDTLGLHAALGLDKRVVALFGPTSPWEVDLYGRGTRIAPDIDCISCYRTACDKSPSCMERIETDAVLGAVKRHLAGGETASALVSREAEPVASALH